MHQKTIGKHISQFVLTISLYLLSSSVYFALADIPKNSIVFKESHIYASSNEEIVLQLTLSKNAKIRTFSLPSPNRFVIDIISATLQSPKAIQPLLDAKIQGIKQIRKGQHDNYFRIVLETHAKIKSDSVTSPTAKNNNTYTIRIKLSKVQYATNVTPTEKLRPVIVVIDPGHGGGDPGAISHANKNEKVIALEISKKLKRYFDKSEYYETYLTRSTDTYLTLKERRLFARDKLADLFVSVHADAYENKRARGASIYVLSEKGATSRSAEILAQRENRSDLIGSGNYIPLNHDDEVLNSVLLSLSMTSVLSTSLNIAGFILNEMEKNVHVHSRKIGQASFVVLKSADIPSVLIETGYISNPREAKLLETGSHQRKLARSIYIGIDKYFQTYPPTNSRLAYALSDKKQEGITYKVQKNDTLHKIARKFKVSITSLKKLNNLSSDFIRSDQKLKIPPTSKP